MRNTQPQPACLSPGISATMTDTPPPRTFLPFDIHCCCWAPFTSPLTPSPPTTTPQDRMGPLGADLHSPPLGLHPSHSFDCQPPHAQVPLPRRCPSPSLPPPHPPHPHLPTLTCLSLILSSLSNERGGGVCSVTEREGRRRERRAPVCEL